QVAISPTGQVVAVYQGTKAPALWYVSGSLDTSGALNANEYSLTEGDTRRGYTPSIAFDAAGHVLVAYRGTENNRLFYVSGSLDSEGRIVGHEFELTDFHEHRRGYTPSVAFDKSGGVVLAYEGTGEHKIFLSRGTLAADGSITNLQETQLIDAAGT